MEKSKNIVIIMIIIFSFLIAGIILTGINQDLFTWVNSFGVYLPSFIWENLTFLGDTLAACSFLILFIRKRPDLVWSGLISALIGTVIVNLIKALFSASRPPLVLADTSINIIGPALYHHSFPSGHAVTIFILASILIFYYRSLALKILMVLLAFIVGISRITVGVHWPLDVLAGGTIGSLCTLIGVQVVEKFRWSSHRVLQITAGIIFIILNSYLLFFYNIRYSQAVCFKDILAGVTLIIGLREFYFLVRKSQLSC